MKKLIALVLTAFLFCQCQPSNNEGSSKPEIIQADYQYYQMITYSFENTKQATTTDDYLKSVYLPHLKKSGISNIGVFKLIQSEELTDLKTYVLIPFSSLTQIEDIYESTAAIHESQQASQAYITASQDEPPYQRMESTIMKAFADMPFMEMPSFDTPRSQRVYELRSYESANERLYHNKVDMFNAGGEVTLFDRLEFNAVFYAEVISGAKMPNLIYMTTFSNQESRDAHWDAFREAPEWLKLKAMPKYQKNVSHADLIFLYPTEYSDY